MKTYRSLKVVRIGGGTVALSKELAGPRINRLEDIGKDVYKVLRPIEFMAGETFGYDGHLSESIAEVLGEEKPKAKDKDKNPEGDTPPTGEGEFVEVRVLADALKKSVSDVCELLKDYGLNVKVWNARVPKDLAQQVIDENKAADGATDGDEGNSGKTENTSLDPA